MSNERDVLLRYYDVWRTGDAGELADVLTSDYVDHNPLAGYGTDRDSAISMVVGLTAQMSHVTLDVSHLIVDGPYAAAHWTMSWVPAISVRNDQPQSTRLRGHDFFHLRDGQISEIWHCEQRV